MELKIPPPLLALIFATTMWGISKADILSVAVPGLTESLSLAILALGLVTNILAVISFRRASTTVNPTKPETTTQLVSSGIYNMTRNPMYLGVLLVLLSWAIWLGSVLNVVVLFLFVWYITTFQIIPEEKALEKTFPETFNTYKSRVRRWI